MKFPRNVQIGNLTRLQAVSWVHISDMTAFYGRIVEKIVQKEPLDSGTSGYYFALGHKMKWWDVLERLTSALEARGLVHNSTIDLWPNDEAVAEAMNVPLGFVQALWNSGYVNPWCVVSWDTC
jgi:hypothetical protein